MFNGPSVLISWRLDPTSDPRTGQWEVFCPPAYVHFWKRDPSTLPPGNWSLYEPPANIIFWSRHSQPTADCDIGFDLFCDPPPASVEETCEIGFDLSCNSDNFANLVLCEVGFDLFVEPSGGFFPGSNLETCEFSFDLECIPVSSPSTCDIGFDLFCVPALNAASETCITGADNLTPPTPSTPKNRWF